MANRIKAPATAQILERAALQAHIQTPWVSQAIFGRKAAPQAGQSHFQTGELALLVFLVHLGALDPGQELRVARDGTHQLEHLFGRVFDQGKAMNFCHRDMIGQAWTRLGYIDRLFRTQSASRMGKPTTPSTIALNKRARFEYHLDERIEAGIALEGWEVKALRAAKVQFGESYVLLKNGQAYLFGCLITPLHSASTHVKPDPMRNRRLLLHRREIDRLIGMVERKGHTIVPIAMYWKKGKVKVEIAVARGKQTHDKRQAQKDRDWGRQKQRLMKQT